MDLSSGTIPVPPSVGDYQILKPLGEGAMGAVFLGAKRGARDFKRMVALKRVKPSPSADIAFDKRLVKEAHIGACLEHPNVVTILDLLEVDDGDLYLVMEYVDGLDLRAWMDGVKLAGAQLPTQLSIQVILDVCNGLEYLHNATDLEGRPLNLIHRDLKPSNILVSRHGQVKIVDFGIARANLLQAESLTGPDNMVGTMRYMSPEQARGETTLDHRTDLFSAAVILYELLTLEPFYEAYTPGELLARAQRADVQPKLAQLPQDLLERQQLLMFLEKSLRVDREARFQSALEMVTELSDILAGMPRVATLRSWLMPGFFPSSADVGSERYARDVTPLTGEQSLVTSVRDAQGGTSAGDVAGAGFSLEVPGGRGASRGNKKRDDRRSEAPQDEEAERAQEPGNAARAWAPEQTIEERWEPGEPGEPLEKTETVPECQRSRLTTGSLATSSEEGVACAESPYVDGRMENHPAGPNDGPGDETYAEKQPFDLGREIYADEPAYESTLADDSSSSTPPEIRLRDLLGLEWPDDTVDLIEPPAGEDMEDVRFDQEDVCFDQEDVRFDQEDVRFDQERAAPDTYRSASVSGHAAGLPGGETYRAPDFVDDNAVPTPVMVPSSGSAPTPDVARTPGYLEVPPTIQAAGGGVAFLDRSNHEVTKPLPGRAPARDIEFQEKAPDSPEVVVFRTPERGPDRVPAPAPGTLKIRLPFGLPFEWLVSAALTAMLILAGVLLSYQSVRIEVFPDNADVFVDGRPIVVGDGAVTLGLFSKHTLTFRREGYRPEEIQVASFRRLPAKIVMELVPSAAPKRAEEPR